MICNNCSGTDFSSGGIGELGCIQCGIIVPIYSHKRLMDKDLIETFTKYDTDKPMVSLVDPSFIIGMAEVLTYGTTKYKIDNWKHATEKDIRRIKDSLLRHTLAYTSGELLDHETNLSHSYHAACNLMFLNYLIEKRRTHGL